ncbi:MAG: hypothetical protein S4CHLAM45_14660 [Chlamydiales bacterium]|nr:hypothetical protein [Chlamydiales bacterium]MCH9620572.1 hypothetical protein [Chlamydiales bacterium]MCH9623556.1 hypothetical protein [Chlamydiales bacterium]
MDLHAEARATLTKFFPKVAYHAFMVVAGAFFLCLSSLCRFNLWFTPVPVTMQTFAILMLGAMLGSRRAPLAVLTYIGCSTLHIPFFLGVLGGPTTGYLLGFVIAAFAVGLLFEKGCGRHIGLTLLAFLGGSTIIYLAGLSWLGALIGFKQALILGFYPFILANLAKVCLATGLITAQWKLKEKRS